VNPSFFVQLYDYTFWAERKLFDCVMTLSDAQYRQPLDFSIGPISEHVVHLMSVEHWWFHFLKTGVIDFIDDEAALAQPRAALRAQWDGVEREVRAYLATLTPEELERRVRPPFWEAGRGPITVWQAMLQVANHSTDHRAQTLAMLHTQFGAPTFEQDLLEYLAERGN
jgi:uncharacterized damage-inducible protein DinB